jgi:hypothetical protein
MRARLRVSGRWSQVEVWRQAVPARERVVARKLRMKARMMPQWRQLQFEERTKALRSPGGKKFRPFEYRKTRRKGNAARSPD